MRGYIGQSGVGGIPGKMEMDTGSTTKTVSITSSYNWTVPTGVKHIHVDAAGGHGFGSRPGGRVQCDIDTTPGEVLYITIGSARNSTYQETTYNATHIAKGSNTMANRILVAGGGGNSGTSSAGGVGGGTTGGAGTGASFTTAGQGGTQSAGGAAGAYNWGTTGAGAAGVVGSFGYGGGGAAYGGVGGAGGDGYFGGGGGGACSTKSYGAYGSGGGGGSSYTHPTYCHNVIHTQGYRTGAGYVTITYEVYPTSSVEVNATQIFKDKGK